MSSMAWRVEEEEEVEEKEKRNRNMKKIPYNAHSNTVSQLIGKNVIWTCQQRKFNFMPMYYIMYP